MNKLAIRLWMDGLNLNVILMFCRYDFAIRQPLHRHDSQSRTHQRLYWYVVVMLCNVWLANSSRAHGCIFLLKSLAKLGLELDLPCLWALNVNGMESQKRINPIIIDIHNWLLISIIQLWISIIQLWISIIHLWISMINYGHHNSIMDIHNSS